MWNIGVITHLLNVYCTNFLGHHSMTQSSGTFSLGGHCSHVFWPWCTKTHLLGEVKMTFSRGIPSPPTPNRSWCETGHRGYDQSIDPTRTSQHIPWKPAVFKGWQDPFWWVQSSKTRGPLSCLKPVEGAIFLGPASAGIQNTVETWDVQTAAKSYLQTLSYLNV